MTKKIKIEFFHDVICSFCFPMSYRMRQLKADYPGLEIQHRSFALGWEAEDFIRQFGSREGVKPEVIHHWAVANRNDDLHRFNIEGMAKTNFNFPLSKNGLIAAKAAKVVAGEEGYWDVFDAIQETLFVENKDIERDEILFEAVKKTRLNFDHWLEAYRDPSTEALVKEDLNLAKSYEVTSAPSLVINEKYLIPGAVPLRTIKEVLEQIAKEEGFELEEFQTVVAGEACHLANGQWKCD